MKEKIFLWPMLLVLLICLIGCASIDEMRRPRATVTTTGGTSIAQAQAEPYYGPKARIAVARFTDKTGKGWITSEIGDGMADMLATALFQTNRFIVLERGIIKEIQEERELIKKGEVRQEKGVSLSEFEGAELLVTGAVTEFEPDNQAARAGIGAGIGGGKWKTLAGILAGFKKAHIALDLRVVDVATSRIVTVSRVQGSAPYWSGSIGGAAPQVPLAAGLNFMSKTPTEEAIRLCLNEAVNFVVAQTPAQYYRPVAPVAAPPPPSSPAPPSAPPQTSTVPAPAEPEKTSLIVVTTPTIIRSDTGTKFVIIERVPKGAQLILLDERGKWYKVRTKTGKEGWILKEMIE